MKKLTVADASKLLKNINTFFFDCDGIFQIVYNEHTFKI